MFVGPVVPNTEDLAGNVPKILGVFDCCCEAPNKEVDGAEDC